MSYTTGIFETNLTDDVVESFSRDGYWTGRLLTDFLDDDVRTVPERTAFVDSRRSVTFAELAQEVQRCAQGLRSIGVEPGDVVSFQLPNWIEFAVVHLACTRIGAISNPLIPIYRGREIGFMVGHARSKVLLVPREFRGFDHLSMVRGLRGDWPNLTRTVVLGDGELREGDGEMSYADLMSCGGDEDLAPLRPDGNDVTAIVFTSGTTGRPKGVMHTHNTLVAANAPIWDRMGLTDSSVLHMASTCAHLTGFLYGARLGVQNGLTCVFQDVWNASTFVDLVREHQISYTSGATPFLLDLLNNLPPDPEDLASLVRFCCMGAPIPRAVVREASTRLPGMAVLGGWGQTEDGLVTIGIPGDDVEKITTTDGYPWPGMEIRVVDFDNNPLPARQEGRLQVRGAFLFVGYALRLDLSQELMSEGGWFDTGDLAEIDEDGYLKIVGRTKDIIIRGGENIPVAYLENVLYEHPDFALVAVVGIPDPRLQERACACVTLKDGVDREFTLDDLRHYLQSKGVAMQYWPERLQVLDTFPTTPSGKIQKFQLRALVTEEQP